MSQATLHTSAGPIAVGPHDSDAQKTDASDRPIEPTTIERIELEE